MKDYSCYLLSLKMSGIKNITETISMDFYKKVIDKNFDPSEYRVKAIYGENGAGKTAIISAIEIFRNVIAGENYLSDSNNQRILDELINKKTKEFNIETTFLFKGSDDITVYRYSFALGKNANDLYEIKRESLEIKNGNYNNNDYKRLYSVENGKLIECKLAKNDRVVLENATANLLNSRSLVSLSLSLVMKETSKSMLAFMSHVIICLLISLDIYVYLQSDDRHRLYIRAKDILAGNRDANDLIDVDFGSLLQDVGVNQKKIHKEDFEKYKASVDGLCSFIKLFKKDLQTIEVETRENRDYLECELVMNYGDYKISEEFESNGIKKLIRLYDSFVAASRGGIVFIDEMDSNINDVYLCKLIEYFMYYSEGQLIFTTHNIDPMNVLKNNKMSIEFLSNDNKLIPWKNFGNSSPENFYKNGMIENLPFNVDPTDFIGVFGE